MYQTSYLTLMKQHLQLSITQITNREHFKVNFQEDFIVDKISDVFLESITINNPSQANS